MVESAAAPWDGGRGGGRGRGVGAVPSQRWSPAPANPAEGRDVGAGPQGRAPGGRVVGSEAWCRRRCRARRSAPYRHVPHREKAPTAVARRNARERRRVEAVNGAFLRLRRAVPPDGLPSGGSTERGKRVSKVKTLHRAIEYITQLQGVLRDAGCQFTLASYGPRGYRNSQLEYSAMLQPYRGEF
ncbi:achaete-scute homolog 1-like [Hetaerina americana]|uniref:achaete-scute homolog 1-like n=1 Tax=Hetaerina americana TaxID=62018 RepID=UPI003A7F0FA9